jgi:hypothetical protein
VIQHRSNQKELDGALLKQCVERSEKLRLSPLRLGLYLR